MTRSEYYEVNLVFPNTWRMDGQHEVRRTESSHRSYEAAAKARAKLIGVGHPYHESEIEIWKNGKRYLPTEN